MSGGWRWAGVTMAVVAAGCARGPAPDPPLEPLSPASGRIEVVLMVGDNQTPTEYLNARLGQGRNWQAMVMAPTSGDTPPRLLDPGSFTVRWNGRPITHHLYYKMPQGALLFIMPDHALLAAEPRGELIVAGRLLGDAAREAALRMVVEIDTAAAMAAPAAEAAKRGDRIRIVDTQGNPVPGALVFGQRREDLLARTNAQGIATLDAPTRNSAAPHYAWARGTWATRFDPVDSPTVTLLPIAASPETVVTLNTQCEDGGTVEGGLLLVGDTIYYEWRQGETFTIRRPPSTAGNALILTATHFAGNVPIESLETGATVTLRRVK